MPGPLLANPDILSTRHPEPAFTPDSFAWAGPRLEFYLGTHLPSWLCSDEVPVPLMVSDTRLRDRVGLPVADKRWALDSGAFTEITRYGAWRSGAPAYADRVRRYHDQIGRLDFAAIQDWPCEPNALRRSGLSVRAHQERTVASYIDLAVLAPAIPWLPVLQGWRPSDYLQCARLYARAGVDLASAPLVGVGSVCRRAETATIALIVDRIAADAGITRLHGFGLKTEALARFGDRLTSCDSLAWSYRARRRPALPGHTQRHPHCNNCAVYALSWRANLLAGLERIPGPQPRR